MYIHRLIFIGLLILWIGFFISNSVIYLMNGSEFSLWVALGLVWCIMNGIKELVEIKAEYIGGRQNGRR